MSYTIEADDFRPYSSIVSFVSLPSISSGTDTLTADEARKASSKPCTISPPRGAGHAMVSQADAGFVKVLLMCIHNVVKGGDIYAHEQAECQLQMEVIGWLVHDTFD